MNEWMGKFVNLGYDFFGVLLPGVILGTSLFMWWFALGDLTTIWSANSLPSAEDFVEHLQATFESAYGFWFGCLAGALTSYFLGHIALWISRGGDPNSAAESSARVRIALALKFQIPKPSKNFAEELEPLRSAVVKELSHNGDPLTWRQCYPVLKSYLSNNLSYSLISTYQNKYTLHRSITAIAALLFWLSIISIIVVLVTNQFAVTSPRWLLLVTILVFSLVVVWGFSASYMYYWKMFGDSVITEAYSLLFGPRDDSKQ
tara:strand:+ start:17569 stop:18348 length:780 start_codon:yes stop_codon:yes gene_type:complete